MVDLSIDLLIRHNCLSYVWAAYLSTFDDRPVSRTTLRISSGVPERTQVRYEDGLRILKYQNFAVSKWPAENIAGIQEFFIPSRFCVVDPNSGEKVVAWRIPDYRVVKEAGIQPRRAGSNRRVNRELKKSSGKCRPGSR